MRSLPSAVALTLLVLAAAAPACGSTSAPVTPSADAAVPADAASDVRAPDGASLDAPGECTDALPAMKLTPVARGLDAPVYVTTAPGERGRLYVVEQTGKVRLVKDGALAGAAVVDLAGRLVFGGERGFLGLAFHPTDGGRAFVHYSGAGDGRTELAELRRTGPDTFDPTPVKIVFTFPQPFANHNGGQLAFGPDGFLYMGLGDGGSGNDPQGNGQKLSTKLGKILRVDVDRYPAAPDGNMTGQDTDPAIWDFGLRNPWRFSFDRKTGDLYIGDVGQNAWEEIDWEPARTGRQNYGWSITEGAVCRPPTTGCDQTGLRPPVAVHGRAEAQSITGGYVYRGAAIPCLRGRYVYGDYVTGRIFSLVMKDGVAGAKQELTEALNPGATLSLSIASFGEDEAGEIYVVAYGGTVYRVDPR